MSLEKEVHEQYLSQEVKIRVPLAIVLALEELLNSDRTPLIADSTARFGEKIGSYQRSVSMALLGLLMQHVHPDQYAYFQHHYRSTLSLEDCRLARERLAKEAMPAPSVNFDTGELEVLIKRLNDQQSKTLAMILEGVAFNANFVLGGTKQDKRIAIKNNGVKDVQAILEEGK